MIDLTNRVFKKLTAIQPTKLRYVDGSVIWECRCECGNIVNVPSTRLLSDRTHQCQECYSKSRKGNKEILAKASAKNNRFKTNIGLIFSDKLNKNNTSGVKGVYLIKRPKQYRAFITFQGVHRILGDFDTIEEATKARRKAEKEIRKKLRALIKKDQVESEKQLKKQDKLNKKQSKKVKTKEKIKDRVKKSNKDSNKQKLNKN